MSNTATKFMVLGYTSLAEQAKIKTEPEPVAPEPVEKEDSHALSPQIAEEPKVVPDMQVLNTLNIQPKISGMRV